MNYKLHLGDCAEVLAGFEANSIDLTVTSPPYDNLRAYNGYSFDFGAVARELYRVTKPGGVLVWVVGDATVKGSETGTSFRQALFLKDVCGFNLHDTMIYDKGGAGGPKALISLTGTVLSLCSCSPKAGPQTSTPLRIGRTLRTEGW